MGLLAGHELSHGFGLANNGYCYYISHKFAFYLDDQGIQWDATGVLNNWMDQKSEEGFQQMANCVIDEYDKFEPIKGHHIDGTRTQGENIADNGGWFELNYKETVIVL